MVNWGDVPSWISVALVVLVPAFAFIWRNAIARFVKRKAAEPVPTGPPPRWFLRPNGKPPTTEWLLVNWASTDAFNVTLHPTSVRSAILDDGYWKRFGQRSLGLVSLRIDGEADSAGIETDFTIEWDRPDGEHMTQTIAALPSKHWNGFTRLPGLQSGVSIRLTPQLNEEDGNPPGGPA